MIWTRGRYHSTRTSRRATAVFVAWLSIIALLVSCSGGGTGGRVEAPDGPIRPTLLGGYWQIDRVHGIDEEQARAMRYRPWQFDSGADLFDLSDPGTHVVTAPGRYRGWDVLATREHRHASVNYPPMDYLLLRLNRDATVAIIWYGETHDLPAWLSGWQRGPDVGISGTMRPTYRTHLATGDHYLGTPERRNVQMYTVLLAEADGTPSPLPSWPAEYGPRLLPNTPIPRDHVLHNVHFAQGPDGLAYPTWHEQIHPVYWTYFEHDHGSDPGTFAAFPEAQPVWGYSDPSVDAGGFFGFKTITLDAVGDDGRTYSFLFTFHVESLSRQRLCRRHHTLDVAVADRDTGELLARIHHLADTGYPQDPTGRRIQPAECPDVAAITATNGRRTINTDPVGAYEAWQYDLAAATSLPFLGGVTILMDAFFTYIGTDTRDGSLTAEHLHRRDDPRMGATRHLQFAGPHFGVDTTVGEWGHFCTDRHGRDRLPCGPDTLHQYIKPGIRIAIPKGDQPRYGVRDPWTGDYVPQHTVGDIINVWRNLEHAISLERGAN
jgi:hypothetical protein